MIATDAGAIQKRDAVQKALALIHCEVSGLLVAEGLCPHAFRELLLVKRHLCNAIDAAHPTTQPFSNNSKGQITLVCREWRERTAQRAPRLQFGRAVSLLLLAGALLFGAAALADAQALDDFWMVQRTAEYDEPEDADLWKTSLYLRVDSTLYVLLAEREVSMEQDAPAPRHITVPLPPFRLQRGKLKYPTICATATDRWGNESACTTARVTLK